MNIKAAFGFKENEREEEKTIEQRIDRLEQAIIRVIEDNKQTKEEIEDVVEEKIEEDIIKPKETFFSSIADDIDSFESEESVIPKPKSMPTEDTEEYWFEICKVILGSKNADSVFAELPQLKKNIDQPILTLNYTLRDAVRCKQMESIGVIRDELNTKLEDFHSYFVSACSERDQRKKREEEIKNSLTEQLEDLQKELEEEKKKNIRLEALTAATPKRVVKDVELKMSEKTIAKFEQLIHDSKIEGISKQELLVQLKPLMNDIFNRIKALKPERTLKKNVLHGLIMTYLHKIGIDDPQFMAQIKEQIIYQIFTNEFIDEFNRTREINL